MTRSETSQGDSREDSSSPVKGMVLQGGQLLWKSAPPRSPSPPLQVGARSPPPPALEASPVITSTAGLELLRWVEEAALARPVEVAEHLHGEAFTFIEARTAAPEQLLQSLMGVPGLKPGECLALTNAMKRMVLED